MEGMEGKMWPLHGAPWGEDWELAGGQVGRGGRSILSNFHQRLFEATACNVLFVLTCVQC